MITRNLEEYIQKLKLKSKLIKEYMENLLIFYIKKIYQIIIYTLIIIKKKLKEII